MSLKKTLVWAILLCAALAYIIQIELPREAQKEKEGLVFPGLAKEVFESVSISGTKGKFVLKNNAPQSETATDQQAVAALNVDALKKWQVADLPNSDLDRMTLNALLNALTSLKLDKPLPHEDLDPDLGVYGLKTPELTIGVKAQGKDTEILFGKENSYVQKRYMKLGTSDAIYLMPAGLFSSANKSVNDFRNHALIDFVEGDLKEIKLQDAQAVTIKLDRGDNFTWRITEPGSYSASAAAVSELSRELRAVRVAEFIDQPGEDLGKFGLAKPELTLHIEFGDAAKRAPIEVRFGKVSKDKTDTSYMRVGDQPTIYSLESSPVSKLLRSLDDFRERQLMQFATVEAVQADFDVYQGKPVSIVKSGNAWTVNGKPGDENFITELLSNLSLLRAEAFPNDERDYGFRNPRLKVVVRLQGGGADKKTTERTLMVGDSADVDAKSESRYYAVTDNKAEPFIISKESYKKITPLEDVLIKAPEATPTPVPAQK